MNISEFLMSYFEQIIQTLFKKTVILPEPQFS